VHLGLINEQAANTDSSERALLYELWQLLRGEQREEVDLEDIRIAVLSILRMTDFKRIGVESRQQQTDQEKEDPTNFGYYNEKQQLCLRQEDIPKVQKHYNVFYLNRLQHIGRILEMQKAHKASIGEYNFKPQLNENSAQIAARYRQKVAEQIKEEKLTTFEWLAAAGNRQAWRDQAKQILQEEELKECTFKPQLLTNNDKLDVSRSMASNAAAAQNNVTNGTIS
jgi:hypothetical protein